MQTGRDAFEAGDYVTAIRTGNPDDWRYWAARGLIGLHDDVHDRLTQFDDPRARYYAAVSAWIDGDDDRAARVLESLPDAKAQRLLALVRKPKIEVLAFMPAENEGAHVIAKHAARDSRFNFKNVGALGEDLDAFVNPDIHRLYPPDRPPDMVVVELIEWHVLPGNLHLAPAPVIGHTSDFDIHIQAVAPWLGVFDAVMVLDQTERQDLAPIIAPTPTLVYPKLFSVQSMQKSRAPRTIDLFMSGTLMSAHHSDKEPLLNAILSMEELRPLLVNGFCEFGAYCELLGRSKLSMSFVRHAGTMPTRALESITMGCPCLVQEESVLHLYLPDRHGLIPYDPENLPQVQNLIRAATGADLEQRLAEAARGAARLSAHFNPTRVASQYLRLCAVVAAECGARAPRRAVSPEIWKRGQVTKGMMPGRPRTDALEKIRERNVHALQIAPANWRALNDQGRESLIEFGRLAQCATPLGQAEYALLNEALEKFRSAAIAAPEHIAPISNYVRAAFPFGAPEQVEDAARMAREALNRDASGFVFDPADDVLPYDYLPELCNTKRLMRAVGDTLAGRASAAAEVCETLHAALAFHVGRMEQDVRLLQQAVQEDPAFKPFQLYLAQALLAEGGASASREAHDLLTRLATDGLPTHAIATLMAAAAHHDDAAKATLDKLADRQRRIAEAFVETHAPSRDLSVWDTAVRLALRPNPASINETSPPALTIVVAGAWNASKSDHIDKIGANLIFVDPGDAAESSAPANVCVISAGENRPKVNYRRVFALGLSQARGRDVILSTDDASRACDLAEVARKLERAGPRRAIAFCGADGDGVLALAGRREDFADLTDAEHPDSRSAAVGDAKTSLREIARWLDARGIVVERWSGARVERWTPALASEQTWVDLLFPSIAAANLRRRRRRRDKVIFALAVSAICIGAFAAWRAWDAAGLWGAAIAVLALLAAGLSGRLRKSFRKFFVRRLRTVFSATWERPRVVP